VSTKIEQVAGASDDWIALYAGDTTLVVQFGETIEHSIVNKVTILNTRIQTAISSDNVHGILETVPGFRSLAIVYDPHILPPDELLNLLRRIDSPDNKSGKEAFEPRHWNLPVLYGSGHGPDLQSVAQLTGLESNDVIELHSGCTFTVYMLGFLPGYAFLGDTPEELYLPRRSEPRLRVPAGSVAIAMQLTGIYPWESPGGWHIIGNCPIPMFNADLSPPALLRSGDKVRFTQIGKDQFDALADEADTTGPDRTHWLTSDP